VLEVALLLLLPVVVVVGFLDHESLFWARHEANFVAKIALLVLLGGGGTYSRVPSTKFAGPTNVIRFHNINKKSKKNNRTVVLLVTSKRIIPAVSLDILLTRPNGNIAPPNMAWSSGQKSYYWRCSIDLARENDVESLGKRLFARFPILLSIKDDLLPR
jgi:hypothetical protein